MSNDQVTVTTNKWFWARIKDALLGLIVGPMMIFLAVTMLWSNEQSSADMISGIAEGQKKVVETSLDAVAAEHDGALVHLTGKLTTSDVLTDVNFSVILTGIVLERKVEMYQWQEKSKSSSTDNYGGSSTTTTTYTYEKVWSSTPMDSADFHEKTGHENPVNWQYNSSIQRATTVNLGAHTLSSDLINMLNFSIPLTLSSVKLSSGQLLTGNSIYIGSDPANPAIGDLRISYKHIPSDVTVSVLAKLAGGLLSRYQAQSGADITRVDPGVRSSVEMFQSSTEENALKTWLFRALGTLLIFIGFLLFFRIIPILAMVIPPLAVLVDFSIALIALVLTVIVAGSVIIVAWFASRPMLSLWVFVLVTVISVWLYRLLHQKRATPAPLTSPEQNPVP